MNVYRRYTVLGRVLPVLLLATVLAGCGLGAYTTQVTETSGVTTPPGPVDLTVLNFNGPITVVPGPDGGVEAEMTRGSRADEPAAQAEADAIRLETTQAGSEVVMETIFTGTAPHQAEAALVITAPAGSTLTLRTAAGTIDARGAFGDVTAQLDTGGIIFGAFEDESFSLVIEGTGELQSDFETLSSRPLTGAYEGQVGDAPTRQLKAVLGEGKVFLRQLSP
jgi:hypothetical protein